MLVITFVAGVHKSFPFISTFLKRITPAAEISFQANTIFPALVTLACGKASEKASFEIVKPSAPQRKSPAGLMR
ncbi:MAG TPA: hypothetical protein DCZ43_03510 [candidate division Zixibacteria bacterium]|nr:hypothetical protein [candidate division Zixibacteria bacterium]